MNIKISVFTTIHYYSPFDDNSTTDSRGKLLYTKDGSIYAQDKNRYTDDVSLSLVETETKFEKKIKKMVRLSKRDYGDEKNVSPAEFAAKYSDPEKYYSYPEEDDDENILYYVVREIIKKVGEFDVNDKEGINKFKGNSLGVQEEKFDKEVQETVKVKKDITKSLNDFITTAKERAEKGEAPRNQFDQYFL